MRVHSKRLCVLAGAAGVLMMTSQAFAGGFAIKEDSAYGQGSSFAGIAAGGALSSMFWNPATITQQPGVNVEADLSGIFPYTKNTPGAGSTLTALGLGGTGNTSDAAAVPSGYASWQVNPNLWLGLSLNSPFGLSVSFPSLWAGRNYAGDTSLRTYNATPTIAVKLNDWISFGAGVQIMYGNASLNNGIGPLPPPFPFPTYGSFNIKGDGWAYGFTAGVTVTPTPTTTIGLGWRSALNLDIDGTLSVFPNVVPGSGAVSTRLKLPDIVTLGIRQKLNAQWTLLGTVEWDDWSRIGTSTLMAAGGAATVGGIPVTLPFQYKDGWFFSTGAEYAWSDALTLRGGLGYEISPISDQVRTPRLPDNDRIWTSVGLSYKVLANLSLDLGYTHLFVAKTSVNVGPGNPWFNPLVPVTYAGTIDSHADIVSIGLRYRFAPPAPEPVLYRKD